MPNFDYSKLLRIRERNGYTQEDLAKLTGVSRGCIAMWETKKYAPSIQTLYKLAKGLNMKMEEFIKEETQIQQ
jgi:transcriptional regulator with XRE-family HTH domain